MFMILSSMAGMYLVVLVFGLALHLIERDGEELTHKSYLRAIAAANLTKDHIDRLVQYGMPDPISAFVDDWGSCVRPRRAHMLPSTHARAHASIRTTRTTPSACTHVVRSRAPRV